MNYGRLEGTWHSVHIAPSTVLFLLGLECDSYHQHLQKSQQSYAYKKTKTAIQINMHTDLLSLLQTAM